MGKKFRGYLRLMRPANILTAISDILAGITIAGYFSTPFYGQFVHVPVMLLVLATIGLYGGGVVFNDVFDAELDKKERPERPIPSGLLSKKNATTLGAILLGIGVLAASLVHKTIFPSGPIALAIAAAALLYDKWGKHYSFWGPLNMGICRGLNLLLGISIIPEALPHYWLLGFIPVLYIAAITMVSRGEVHGGKRSTLYAAAVLYAAVIASIFVISYTKDTLFYSAIFLVLFGIMISFPLFRAIQNPKGPQIGKAVKAGVLALVLMNAAWAAAFGMMFLAMLIILLLPLSIWMARAFAVT